MQEEAVVVAGQIVDDEGGEEIDLRPGQGAPDGAGRRAEAAGDQEIDDAGDDAAVADEEADKPDVRETNLEVGSKDGLEGATDSPEIGDFRPAPPGGQ